ncbi:glycosyltransferase family 2 protein, partial [Paenibacillus glucanolyticus]
MRLSVIVPVLNEITFIPLYIESVSRYADEIIIADGGSTDGTLEQIDSLQNRYPIRLLHVQQKGLPYTEDWNESVVRNVLIEQAQGDWIMNLDIDELMDDRFVEVLPELMNRTDVDVYQFPFVNFWGDPWTIRVNSPGDERWS